MLGGSLMCMGTCGNGVEMHGKIMKRGGKWTRFERALVRPGACCVAALGSLTPGTAVQRSASGATPSSGTGMWACVCPQVRSWSRRSRARRAGGRLLLSLSLARKGKMGLSRLWNQMLPTRCRRSSDGARASARPTVQSKLRNGETFLSLKKICKP